MSINSYATDGRCHNAQPGSYGHECGRPAVFIGRSKGGFEMGFCSGCRGTGYEAGHVVEWRPAVFWVVRHPVAGYLKADYNWSTFGYNAAVFQSQAEAATALVSAQHINQADRRDAYVVATNSGEGAAEGRA